MEKEFFTVDFLVDGFYLNWEEAEEPPQLRKGVEVLHLFDAVCVDAKEGEEGDVYARSDGRKIKIVGGTGDVLGTVIPTHAGAIIELTRGYVFGILNGELYYGSADALAAAGCECIVDGRYVLGAAG